MPALFALPQVVPLSALGAILPGSKLYFYDTGTTDAKPVYTDIDLSVAHAQPVVADASGVFDPIYLDPEGANYRVKLTDSSDVQLWQLDDIPASQNVTTALRIKADTVDLIFEETDAAANNKKSRIRVSAQEIAWQLLNDAESVATDIARIARSGTTLGTVTIAGVPYFASGSFTGTLTGFATDPTPTIEYRRTGNIVTLTCNSGSTGTSDDTTMTLTGMPVSIRPAQVHTVITRVQDNGTNQVGVASIATSGTITFGLGAAGGNFTGSGTKGLPGGWSLHYELG
jgi:hypothetical protein